ncbi:hypothetical protein ACIPL1_26160 [Pseudomonas sp. NPDC090202]|uniref:hypothetical protein n=1 Tax=unclassified Pseudomonas TaxID=196821 RepID=UPI0037F70C5A
MKLQASDFALLSLSGLFMTGFSLFAYAAATKTNEALKSFKNSKLIKDIQKQKQHLGLMGKILTFNMIGMSILFSGPLARRKLVDRAEIRAFPKNLKLWIFVPMCMYIPSFFLLIWLTR